MQIAGYIADRFKDDDIEDEDNNIETDCAQNDPSFFGLLSDHKSPHDHTKNQNRQKKF